MNKQQMIVAAIVALPTSAFADAIITSSFETDTGLEVYGTVASTEVSGLEAPVMGEIKARGTEFGFGIGLEDAPVALEFSVMPNAEDSIGFDNEWGETNDYDMSFSYASSSLLIEPIETAFGRPFFRGGIVGAEYNLEHTYTSYLGDVETTEFTETDYGPLYGIGWSGEALDGALGYRFELRKAEVFGQKPDLTSISLSYRF